MIQKVMDYLPHIIIVLTMLISHQLGSERFPYVIVLFTVASCAVMYLTKRTCTSRMSVASDSKIQRCNNENNKLKDNLMKVYQMLQEQKKAESAAPPPPPPQETQAPPTVEPRFEEMDSKPYA